MVHERGAPGEKFSLAKPRGASREEQIDRVECRARDDDDAEASERELKGTVRCLRWKKEDRKSEGTAYFTTDRVVWSLQ